MTTDVVTPSPPAPAEAPLRPPKRGALAEFFLEIGRSFQPYAVFIIKDWLIGVLLWASLWAFHLITTFVKVEGWEGDFIVAVHATGVLIAFVMFAALLILDIIEHRRRP